MRGDEIDAYRRYLERKVEESKHCDPADTPRQIVSRFCFLDRYRRVAEGCQIEDLFTRYMFTMLANLDDAEFFDLSVRRLAARILVQLQ